MTKTKLLTILLMLPLCADAKAGFGAWHNSEKWDMASDTILSNEQRAKLGQLWQEKQRIDPGMPNRGASFVKIMEYVVENVK